MATTVLGARLTEAHRLAQARLGATTSQQMLTAWQLLDPEALDATTPSWLRVTVPLVTNQRDASARLAANYYTAFRRIEHGGEFLPVVDMANDVRAVATSLTVTGPVRVKMAMERRELLGLAVENAKVSVAGAAMRQALEGGRRTITRAVRDDERALGWARATSGRACYFCAMLASRGPVYGEENADFEAHDHCSCTAEPVYDEDADWPSGARQYREQWDSATAGRSGDDAIREFRRSFTGE